MNIMILHTKIYSFVEYCYPLLNKYPTTERFSLEQYIRNALYHMLEECIKYMHSGTISHLYAIDTDLAMIKDFFKLSRDLDIKVINESRIIVITTKLDEIGRILGGIINNKQGKAAKNVVINAVSFFNQRTTIIPFTFDTNNNVPDYLYADQIV